MQHRPGSKTKMIKVRVTPERYKTYANVARRNGTTVSTLARNALDRTCGADAPVAPQGDAVVKASARVLAMAQREKLA